MPKHKSYANVIIVLQYFLRIFHPFPLLFTARAFFSHFCLQGLPHTMRMRKALFVESNLVPLEYIGIKDCAR